MNGAPKGYLLVAHWLSPGAFEASQAEGFVIIDPVTCEAIYNSEQPAGKKLLGRASSIILAWAWPGGFLFRFTIVDQE